MMHFIGSLSDCQALAARVDTALGMPCCHCYVDEVAGCECAKHAHPDGSPASHAGSCTVTYSEPFAHPDGVRWAYPLDATVVSVAPELTGQELADDWWPNPRLA